MKVVYVILISSLIAFATSDDTPIDWYDCTKSPDGNFHHPFSCHRFIACANGEAYDKSCDDCSVDPIRCPEGHLIYNVTTKTCLGADETACGNGEVTTHTRTAKNCLDSTDPPKEGSTCNTDECKGVQVGYCQRYLKCDESGKWAWEACGEDLFWNPANPNPIKEIQPGQCNPLGSLTPQEELLYRTDPDCLASFWKALGECERDYEYQAAYELNRKVRRLSCAEGLVFSQKKETCQWCHHVKREDGSFCCSKVTPDEIAPRAAQEETDGAAPEEVPPEEIITETADENAPRAGQEEVVAAAPEEVPPEEIVTETADENAPRAAQEEVVTAAPEEVPPEEIITETADENAPRAAQDEVPPEEYITEIPNENVPRALQEKIIPDDATA